MLLTDVSHVNASTAITALSWSFRTKIHMNIKKKKLFFSHILNVNDLELERYEKIPRIKQ